MLRNLSKNKKGFTIIEVLIVLAIAGLIIVIVLLAVPGLQRNNRNTARKTDAARASALLQEAISYSTNGSAPATEPAQVSGATYSALTNRNYNISATGFQALVASGSLADDTLYIRNFSVCTGNIGVTGGTARQYTFTYLIETPGATASGSVPAGRTAQCISS